MPSLPLLCLSFISVKWRLEKPFQPLPLGSYPSPVHAFIYVTLLQPTPCLGCFPYLRKWADTSLSACPEGLRTAGRATGRVRCGCEGLSTHTLSPSSTR